MSEAQQASLAELLLASITDGASKVPSAVLAASADDLSVATEGILVNIRYSRPQLGGTYLSDAPSSTLMILSPGTGRRYRTASYSTQAS